MVKVKPLEVVKKNYSDAANIAAERYKEGISQTSGWKEKATSSEAEELWKAKMQEAIAAERRRKALERVSESEWKEAAVKKGYSRIGQGMRAAVDKHAKNWAPYKEALEAVSLPPRSIDPMANIDNRLKPVVQALVNKKKEIKG